MAHAARLRWIEVALLLGAMMAAYAFHAREPSRLPTREDYKAATEAIRNGAKPGDAVFLVPHWAERARLFIDTTPVLNLGRHPTREDLADWNRLLVLTLPDLPRSERDRARATLHSFGFEPASAPLWGSSRLEVTVFTNTHPEHPSYRFSDHAPRPAEVREIDGKPFRCLHARPGETPVALAFSQVPLESSLRIVGGLIGQIAYRHDHFAPVELEVVIDGQARGHLTFPPGEPGERRLSIDTSDRSVFAEGLHDVRFELSASNPDQRDLCFDAGVYP